jgi:hypothetical protein
MKIRKLFKKRSEKIVTLTVTTQNHNFYSTLYYPERLKILPTAFPMILKRDRDHRVHERPHQTVQG